MKRTKKWLLALFIIFLFFFGLAWLFTFLYADEIKQYGVQQVNKLVNTEISVEKIEFSVFRRFPSASLAFENVSAKEVVTGREKGNLFAAKSLYLEFNILKVIKGEYRLKGISLEDGEVNIHIDKDGKVNYRFWKENEEETNSFVLELEKVDLKNIELTFKNDLKNTLWKQQLKKATITGMFSAKEYELNIDGLLFIRTYQADKNVFIRDRNVFLKVALSVDQEKSNYLIKSGAFSVEDLHFFLSGDITMGEEANLVNLSFTGNKLSIPSLISLLPEKYKSGFAEYDSDGEIRMNGLMRGWISATKNPEIKIDFNLQQGRIKHRASGLELRDIYLTGGLTNGSRKEMSSSVLTIDSAWARLGNGSIAGKYKISDFDQPFLDMAAQGKNLLLEELVSFFPADSIETLKGQMDLDLRIRGNIQDLSKMTVNDFRKAKTLGKARIRNGAFAFKKSRYLVEELNASLIFNNNDVKVEQLSGKIFENDFEIEGFFKNLLPYLFADNEALFLRARFHSRQLKWDDFMPPSEDESDEAFAFPDRVTFELTASVDAFRFRNFSASDFNGVMSYHERKFTLRDAVFKSMQGSVSGALRIDAGDPARIVFTVNGKAEKVDVEEVFRSFDNFGQNMITDKNLKGICTADVRFSSVWNEKWEIDRGSISTVANILLERGELINYQPVYSLSKFIELEELNHIRFSSLQNEIEIRDKKIYIPEMDIQSSALNLSLSGIHSFDNEIDYHFALLLRDILSKKARRAKKENEEFGGHVVDDGLGRSMLFLKMTGTVDDPRIAYDRKGLRKKWENDLQEEKQTIKSILREEFGKDPGDDANDALEKHQEYDFQMEWEENNKQEEKEEHKEERSVADRLKKDTAREKKGLNKWINKIAKPNDQEYEKYDPDELE